MYAYWELKTWFSDIDYVIIGSGIVGLSCAIELRKKYPDSKILVLERGSLPSGASTKNAGFACFGSASELITDRKSHSDDEVLNLVEMRIKGLEILRSRLGDKNIGYKSHGGYELFQLKDEVLFQETEEHISDLNNFLQPIIKEPVYQLRGNDKGFKKVLPHLIFNPYEGQIDTGLMMRNLIKLAVANDILILNDFHVSSISSTADGVRIATNHGEINTHKVIVANNGFAAELLDLDVKPARAQVLITTPIDHLPFQGTYHMDRGYYYFRNIDNRVLFGGGRNLDIEGETTTEIELSTLIQEDLEKKLRTIILPERDFEIEHRWSGIMGMGQDHLPIIKQLDANIYCAVRLSGMGIALGSYLAKALVDKIDL